MPERRSRRATRPRDGGPAPGVSQGEGRRVQMPAPVASLATVWAHQKSATAGARLLLRRLDLRGHPRLDGRVIGPSQGRHLNQPGRAVQLDCFELGLLGEHLGDRVDKASPGLGGLVRMPVVGGHGEFWFGQPGVGDVLPACQAAGINFAASAAVAPSCTIAISARVIPAGLGCWMMLRP